MRSVDTPCIEWAGANARGYGQKWTPDGVKYVHRLAWEAAHGPIPDRVQVRHRCDNPPCYNVDHLELGTHQDNMDDMTARERQRRGEQHHKARLREDDVRNIRSSTEPRRALAAQYGVSVVTIRHIQRRQTWRHVA